MREHTISLKVSKFVKVSLDHFVTAKCQDRKIEYINLLTDLVVSFSGGDYFYVLVSFLIDAVKISLFSSSMQLVSKGGRVLLMKGHCDIIHISLTLKTKKKLSPGQGVFSCP